MEKILNLHKIAGRETKVSTIVKGVGRMFSFSSPLVNIFRYSMEGNCKGITQHHWTVILKARCWFNWLENDITWTPHLKTAITATGGERSSTTFFKAYQNFEGGNSVVSGPEVAPWDHVCICFQAASPCGRYLRADEAAELPATTVLPFIWTLISQAEKR